MSLRPRVARKAPVAREEDRRGVRAAKKERRRTSAGRKKEREGTRGRNELTFRSISSRQLMSYLVHRVKPIGHRSQMKLLHLHLYIKTNAKNSPKPGQSIDADLSSRLLSSLLARVEHSPFCVNVPVLSLNRYSILPSSSGSVDVRTMVPGISGSFWI